MEQLCYYRLFNHLENKEKLSIGKSPYSNGGFSISNNNDIIVYLGAKTPLDNYYILYIIDKLKKLKLDYGTMINNSKRDNSKITKYESILNPELYNPHCTQ